MPRDNPEPPDLTERQPTRNYCRTLALYRRQKGLCWICGFPMLPPLNRGNLNRLVATLDHLAPKWSTKGRKRPVKAAHRWCNSARHHDREVSAVHLARMRGFFAKPNCVNVAFSDAQNRMRDCGWTGTGFL